MHRKEIGTQIKKQSLDRKYITIIWIINKRKIAQMCHEMFMFLRMFKGLYLNVKSLDS